MSYVLKKYGTATVVVFPLVDAGAVDFEATPVTHAAGDTKISKDEGAFANTTNAFAHEGNGIYSLALTATEMQAATIVVTIIDQGTKAFEDQAIIIDTYGNASAEHAFDLDVATQDVNVAQISADSAAADNLEAMFDNTGYTASNSTIGTVTNLTNANPTVAQIADGVWDEDIEAAHGTDATAGLLLRVLGAAISNRANNATLNAILGVADSAGVDLPEQVWSETARILTANTNFNDPSAATIADAVWDEARAGHVGAGSFGEGVLVEDVNATGLASINAQMVDVIFTDTISELAQAAPSATPTVASGLMLLYMIARNKFDVTNSTMEVHNDAGTVITKKTLTDDGTTYSEAEMAAGP